MDGRSWTSNAKVADAIDKSQDTGNACVTLLADDGESFDELLGELAGICTEQTPVSENVVDFSGSDEHSSPWAIQLCLKPLRAWKLGNGDDMAEDLKKALDLLADWKREGKTKRLLSETEDFLDGFR